MKIWRDASNTTDRFFLFVPLLSILLAVPVCVTASRVVSNGKIAFVSDRDGNQEIYTMNSDGSDQVRLTTNPGIDNFPTWSPDGNRIAYVSEDEQGQSIKLMNADGSTQIRLVTTKFPTSGWYDLRGYSLRWSPDGLRLVLNQTEGIFVVTISDQSVAHIPNTSSLDLHPSWSPSGSRIMFGSSRGGSWSDIYTINLDGTGLERISDSGALGYVGPIQPDWSRKNNRIAYVFDWGAGINGTSLCWFNMTFRDESDCIESPIDSEVSNPTWSPDNTKLAYTRLGVDGNQIAVGTRNGNALEVLWGPGNNFNQSWQPRISSKATPDDFDGDGRSDISVFRPSDRIWYLDRSTEGFAAVQFGLSADKITPCDFDGDGRTDISVFRDGVWYWINSSSATVGIVQFGQEGDIPVPADYSGDGRDEIAVYRGGEWWILNLANNQLGVLQFGLETDKPVVADYDGDGHADPAVYRDGQWHFDQSTLGYSVLNFGLATDVPVVGDYDGDGEADPAVYRNGAWYTYDHTSGPTGRPWGSPTDIAIPGDYDGDGKADSAIFRAGAWWVNKSAGGFTVVQFGLVADKPLQTAFLP